MTRSTGTSAGETEVVDSSSSPDYGAVELPSKPPKEYSYVERRAELLRTIVDLGHPYINQREEAERYGVSQQQISKDLDRLAEHINAELGNRRDLTTEAVFRRCLRGLLAEQEYKDVWKVTKEWNEFIDDRQELMEMEQRLDELEGAIDR